MTTAIPTGSTLLDLMMNGGWPVGRISNITGLQSTGKTQLAIEAAVNLKRINPKGGVCYVDTEAAFDERYAETLGLDTDQYTYMAGDAVSTVESFFAVLVEFMKEHRDSGPNLFIMDSLDALSDEAEQTKVAADLKAGKDWTKGSYGAEKAKALSKFFRSNAHAIAQSNTHLMLISQLRENLSTFGYAKYTRSGGKALGYYASVVVNLTHTKTLHKTIKKIKHPTGIMVKAKTTKNKVGRPFTECEFPILFDYGIDDDSSCISWLDARGADRPDMDPDNYDECVAGIKQAVIDCWDEEQAALRPQRSKYRKDS